MDLFLATCQGIGLALAAGTFGGASGRRGGIGFVLAAAAAIGGGILFGASLSMEDHPAWPGWLLGAVIAVFTFGIVNGVVAGALARHEGASSIGIIVALGALVLAVVSLFVEPLALVALLAIVWLGSARRRRAQRKHEGLRVLR
jgi:chromate transport protein ChrA